MRSSSISSWRALSYTLDGDRDRGTVTKIGRSSMTPEDSDTDGEQAG
jgi:hypothetical protein